VLISLKAQATLERLDWKVIESVHTDNNFDFALFTQGYYVVKRDKNSKVAFKREFYLGE
jgi:flagellar basal body rod protein FlgG